MRVDSYIAQLDYDNNLNGYRQWGDTYFDSFNLGNLIGIWNYWCYYHCRNKLCYRI